MDENQSDKIKVTVASIEGLTKADLPEVVKLLQGEHSIAVTNRIVEKSTVNMERPAAKAGPAEAPAAKPAAPAAAPPAKKEAPAAAAAPAKAPAAPPAKKAAPAPTPEPEDEDNAERPAAPARKAPAPTNGASQKQQRLAVVEPDPADDDGLGDPADEGDTDGDGDSAAEGEAGEVDLTKIPEKVLRAVKHQEIVDWMHKAGHNQDEIVEACKTLKKEGKALSLTKLLDVETRVRAYCNANDIE